MFRRILLPLDGSRAAEAVLDRILPMAQALGSTVDLLHVVPDRRSLARMGPEDPLDWRMSCRRAAEYLGGVQKRLVGAGVPTETRVEEGGPAAIIVSLLREGHYQLVALTPHGLGGREDLAMGATSGAVILHAPSSLLLVPSGVEGGAGSRILVPVDGSPRADWSLSMAFHLAGSLGTELHLVHALIPPRRFGGPADEPGAAEAVRRLMDADRAAALRYMAQARSRNAPGIPGIEGRILEGGSDIVTLLLEAVGTLGVDLVILSSHGREESSETRLGAVPLRFLLASPVPTLVIQDHPSPSIPATLQATARQDAPHPNP